MNIEGNTRQEAGLKPPATKISPSRQHCSPPFENCERWGSLNSLAKKGGPARREFPSFEDRDGRAIRGALVGTFRSQNPHPNVAKGATLGWGTRHPAMPFHKTVHQAGSLLSLLDAPNGPQREPIRWR